MRTEPIAASTMPMPGATAPAPAVPASTLPEPQMDEGTALAMLMRLTSDMNDTALVTGTAGVKAASSRRSDALKKQMDALKKAVDAQEKARKAQEGGGFFGKILKNLGPVGLVGMCVGSIYIVAADLALHATGLMRNKADLADLGAAGAMCAGAAGIAIFAAEVLVKKYGPDELQAALDKGPTVSDDDVRKANSIALMVYQAEVAMASAVFTGGTGTAAMVACIGTGISTATSVAQESGALEKVFGEDARYVALGGTLVGAGLAIGGSAASIASGGSSLSTLGRVAKTGVEVARGATQVVDGAEQIEAAGYQHDADTLQVDAKRQKQILAAIERTVDALVAELKDKQEHASKLMEICASMNDTHNAAMLTAGTVRA